VRHQVSFIILGVFSAKTQPCEKHQKIHERKSGKRVGK
jgi:hypothetical protein